MTARSKGYVSLATFVLAVAGTVDGALACATCFGDPDSQMVKGALMGVYVMIGVVGFVLVGFAGTGIYWIQRSRRLAGSGEAPPGAGS